MPTHQLVFNRSMDGEAWKRCEILPFGSCCSSIWAWFLTVSDDFLQHHVVQLVLEGVDTVATVSVNGQAVVNTDNMFRRYVADVKQVLQVRDYRTTR